MDRPIDCYRNGEGLLKPKVMMGPSPRILSYPRGHDMAAVSGSHKSSLLAHSLISPVPGY